MEEKKAVKNFAIILLIVLLCGIAVYFITRAFVSKDLFKKEEEESKMQDVTLSYDTALVGTMLNRPSDDYYVVLYNEAKDQSFVYANFRISYTRETDHKPLYFVDLGNKLNEGHESDKTDVSGEVKDMKFGEFTLLRVQKGKITKTITDIEKAAKELKIEL